MKVTKAQESAGLEFIVSIYFTTMRIEKDKTWDCHEAQSSKVLIKNKAVRTDHALC